MVTKICVFINLAAVKQTEAAVLFRSEKKDIWIPKSHIFAKREKGFWVTKWLMEQKKVKLPSVPPKEMRKENINFSFLPQNEAKQSNGEDEKDQEKEEEEVTYHYPDEIEITEIKYDSDLFRSEPKCEVLNEFRIFAEHYCIIRRKATDKTIIDICLHQRDEQLPMEKQMKEKVIEWIELSSLLKSYKKTNERTFCIYPNFEIEITFFELVKREESIRDKFLTAGNPFFEAIKISMEKDKEMQSFHNQMNGSWVESFPKPEDPYVEHWLINKFQLGDFSYLVDYFVKSYSKINTMESLLVTREGNVWDKKVLSKEERIAILNKYELHEEKMNNDGYTEIRVSRIGLEKQKKQDISNESFKIR